MPDSESRPIPDPWGWFLRALDGLLAERVDLHCIGGFVVTMQYGLSRTTSDIDVLESNPSGRLAELQRLAGEGSDLHRRYGVYLQPVRIVTYPEDYELRLIRMWPDHTFDRLRLFALEAHDLALTKLERNSDVDREDVVALARSGFLSSKTLRERYTTEFRPNLASGEKKHDLTMELWGEMCWSLVAAAPRDDGGYCPSSRALAKRGRGIPNCSAGTASSLGSLVAAAPRDDGQIGTALGRVAAR